MNNRTKGKLAEQLAREWLQSRGLVFRESNYHCRMGEIDLIMRDGNTLVFVEVRMRKISSHGGALASVTRSKQQKLMRAIEHYILTRSVAATQVCRVDVVAIDGHSEERRIEWVKNAITQ